ncbi:MAG: DUF4347 domain-containing protein, partial [Pseudomonadota bacterium]
MKRRPAPTRIRPSLEWLESRVLYSTDIPAPWGATLDAEVAQVRLFEEALDAGSTASPSASTPAPGERIDVGRMDSPRALTPDRDSGPIDTPTVAAAQILFVDAGVEAPEALFDTARARGIEVVTIGADRSGLLQVVEALADRSGIQAVHLIAHASPGSMQLGADRLDLTFPSEQTRQLLERLGASLAQDGDLLIYGCDFAQGEVGLAAVAELARLTRADVKASDDPTGHARSGGDWTLEIQSGVIDTTTLDVPQWQGVLDLIAQGTDQQVHASAADVQLTNWAGPAVALDASGRFVAAWFEQDIEESRIQRYEADGTAAGSPTLLGQPGKYPVLAMDNAGNSVVAWTGSNIWVQRFDAAGAAVGSPANAVAGFAGQHGLTIAMAPESGRYAVAAISVDQTRLDVRVFNADGSPLTGLIRVDRATGNELYEPALAMDDDGDFVVAWSETGAGIYAARYDRTGQAAGSTFQVAAVPSALGFPSVGMDAFGRFAIAWTDTNGAPFGSEIKVQLYDNQGVPVGSSFLANTTTASSQGDASLAMGASGEFVLSWMSYLQDGSGHAIIARQFAPDGRPLSGEVIVNQGTVGDQREPSVAFRDGRAVISWRSLANDVGDIFVRRLQVTPLGDGPSLDLGTYDPVHVEGAAPIEFRLASVTDLDSLASETFHITFGLATGGVSGDLLSLRRDPPGTLGGIDVVGNNVLWYRDSVLDGLLIGNVTGAGTVDSPLQIVLQGPDATNEARHAVLRHLQFSTQHESPVATTRLLKVVVTDASGNSDVASAAVTVTPVNDAPTMDLDPDDSSQATAGNIQPEWVRGGGPASIVDSDAILDDVDSALLVRLTARFLERPGGESDVLSVDTSGTGLGSLFDATTGTLEVMGEAPIASYRQILRSLTFDNSEPHAPLTTRVVEIEVSDGSPAISQRALVLASSPDETLFAGHDPQLSTVDLTEYELKLGQSWGQLVRVDTPAAIATGSRIKVGIVLASVDGAAPSDDIISVSLRPLWNSPPLANGSPPPTNALATMAASAIAQGAGWYEFDMGTPTLLSDTPYVLRVDSSSTVGGIFLGVSIPSAALGRPFYLSDGNTYTGAIAAYRLTARTEGAAPAVSAPAGFTVTEDVAGNLTYTGTPFADADSATLTVTLSIADGVLAASSGGGVTVAGTATARTFDGTPAALNAFFTTAGNITYTTALHNTAARTLTTQVSDGSASASASSTVTITPVNDAPALSAAASPTLGSVLEGALNPSGVSVAALLVDGSITDPDGAAAEALALTALDTSLGTWQYSLDGGANWLTVDAALVNSQANELALLLAPTAQIRLVPFGDLN